MTGSRVCFSCNLSLPAAISPLSKKALLGFADAIGRQESRRAALGVPSLANFVLLATRYFFGNKHSWIFFSGFPGAIALAFRPHVAAQLAPLGLCGRRRKLWASGRWFHASLWLRSANHSCHGLLWACGSVYPNSRLVETNEANRSASSATSCKNPDVRTLKR